MDHFRGFLGPNSHKYDPILLKFSPEVAFKVTKTVFEKLLENPKFYRNWTFPKFALFFFFFQL